MAAMMLGLAVGCDRQADTGPGAGPGAGTPGGDSAARRIAVIPKGTTHEFWQAVHAGAVKAAREAGNIEVVFRGPEREDDRAQQIELVQNFIGAGVVAIVLAPLDETALRAPVRDAGRAEIPVVIIDSALQGEVGEDFVSFVATDNYQGGRLAAERLGELLGGQGTALLLRYQEGSASTAKREQGFVDGLREEFPEIELIDPQRYAGPTASTAQRAAESLLLAHRDVDGIFCPNESSTRGMLLALKAAGLAGKTRLIGFDAAQPLLAGVRAGEIQGLVVQNPFKMGYLGVKTALDHVAGTEVPARIDTGVALVTPENIAAPELQELLNPPVDTYLDR
jgi:ribose transport system substrate-binding protein